VKKLPRSKRPFLGTIGASAVIVASLTLTASRVNADEAPINTNVIEFLTYVRGAQGVVRCGIFEREGWLKKTVQPATAKIYQGRALCVFRNIPPGTYGISAFHDANNNGKIDTNFLGMPTEDYCASRNARGVFGPPSFEDAKFVYAGHTLRLAVSMK